MSDQGRAFIAAGFVLAAVAALAFAAVFTFGYLACFTSGAASDHYFNAAMVSVFLAVVAGGGAAMAFVGAS